MNSDALDKTGRDIVLAHRYLSEVYAQIRGMLKSSDNLMAKKGWKTTDAKNVTYDLGPSIREHHDWLATWFLKFYSNPQTGPRSICGFEIYLNSLPGFDTPTCLVFAARLARAWNHRLIWDAWRNSEPLFECIRSESHCSSGQLRRVSSDAYEGCMPLAEEFACGVVPLCEMSDESELESRIISPIIMSASELASQSKTRVSNKKSSKSRKGSR